MTQRFKLMVEYDGGPYVGFQYQDTGPTIQAALEDAVFKLTGERARIFVAGRTDAGVHALGQVAHVDIDKPLSADVVMDALNAHLVPQPIAILGVEAVSDDFHARFSATGRAYLYRMLNRRAPPTVDAGRVWHVKKPLDVDAMHAAAQLLVGTHDFTTFRAANCQAKSPVKTLDRLDVSRVGEEVHVVAESRSFLHHQVRSMAGTLKLVGDGKWTAKDLQAALDARDRTALGMNAPACGLYLTRVSYD